MQYRGGKGTNSLELERGDINQHFSLCHPYIFKLCACLTITKLYFDLSLVSWLSLVGIMIGVWQHAQEHDQLACDLALSPDPTQPFQCLHKKSRVVTNLLQWGRTLQIGDNINDACLVIISVWQIEICEWSRSPHSGSYGSREVHFSRSS